MKSLSSCIACLIISASAMAQNVGIGTTHPNSSALLDVSSTNQGFLYPRMTTQQRSAIVNPADGLHIYNTDMGAPEYYNGQLKEWMCICEASTESFRVFKISFTKLEKETIVIEHGKYGIDTTVSDSALIIISVASSATLNRGMFIYKLGQKTKIILINKGNIYGIGGNGGRGGGTGSGNPCISVNPENGSDGGAAVHGNDAVNIDLHNYGILAGGGGGGAGGILGNTMGKNGGGGGGGAGRRLVGQLPTTQNSRGGYAGGNIDQIWNGQPQPICGFTNTNYANTGIDGNETTGGLGGNGINGGGKGGDGGDLGKPGQSTASAKGGKAGNCFYWEAGQVNFYNYYGGQLIGPSYY